MVQDEYDAIIVGGGASGIISAIQLKKKIGLKKILIIERSSRFGGTWNANTYPGCGCDVPTKLYSFSFEQRKQWKAFFSLQDEIRDYMEDVAKKYGLYEQVLFEHEASEARWDAKIGRWKIIIRDIHELKDTKNEYSMKELSARIFVSGMGALSVPRECNIPGVEKFKGPLFHSARWDHSVDVTNKNVVVIGNGCSASQIIPVIAPTVKQLTQVVRSKHWVSPQLSDLFEPFAVFNKYVPGFYRFERLCVALFLESHFIQADKKWGEGARKRYAAVCEKYIRSCAPKEYHEMLIPTREEVQVACKRRIFDAGYIPSLARKNVEMTTDQVKEIVENGIILESGRSVPADIIVHANGFKAETFSLQMEIYGEQRSLRDYWNQSGVPQAYRGTMISEFPNMFLIWGPNTVTGHFSAIWTIECCIELMTNVLVPVFHKNASPLATINVKTEAEEKEQRYIQDRMKDKIYTTGCGAWYTDESTGKVTALAPCLQYTWQKRCRNPVLSDFIYKNCGPKPLSVMPLSIKVGSALKRGDVEDPRKKSPITLPYRIVKEQVTMRSWQAMSWAIDHIAGWEYPERLN